MTHPRLPIGHDSLPLRVSHRVAVLASCLAAIVGVVTMARADLKLQDECMETSTAFVRLPSSTGGTLDARTCATCDSIRLSFESATRYLVGPATVSYQQLLDVVGKDTTPMLVCYEPASRALSRLGVPEQLSQ